MGVKCAIAITEVLLFTKLQEPSAINCIVSLPLSPITERGDIDINLNVC